MELYDRGLRFAAPVQSRFRLHYNVWRFIADQALAGDDLATSFLEEPPMDPDDS